MARIKYVNPLPQAILRRLTSESRAVRRGRKCAKPRMSLERVMMAQKNCQEKGADFWKRPTCDGKRLRSHGCRKLYIKNNRIRSRKV